MEVKVRGILGAWLNSTRKCSLRLGRNATVFGPPAVKGGSQDT